MSRDDSLPAPARISLYVRPVARRRKIGSHQPPGSSHAPRERSTKPSARC